MIKVEAESNPHTIEQVNQLFMTILPRLQRRLRFSTRHLSACRREEAVSEGTGIALAAVHNLVKRKKECQVKTAGFLRYILKAVQNHRYLADHSAGRDALSGLGRKNHGLVVVSLQQQPKSEDRCDTMRYCLADLVEDPREAVADQVAFKMDFTSWLGTMSARDRDMMSLLAAGEKPGEVAEKYGISRAAVSLRRKNWQRRWEEFIAT